MKTRLQDVTILDTHTGETVTYEDEHYFDDEYDSDFIWDEGNFSCDCNRALFFLRAKGVPEEDIDHDDDTPCNFKANRYLVRILEKDGRVFFNDMSKHTGAAPSHDSPSDPIA